MIIYTDKLIPKGFDSITLGTVILIRPNKRGDIQLIRHEEAHVRQFWRSFGLFPILYLVSKTYRLKCEVEAYKESMDYGMPWHDAAYNLRKYDSGLSYGAAIKLLGGAP